MQKEVMTTKMKKILFFLLLLVTCSGMTYAENLTPDVVFNATDFAGLGRQAYLENPGDTVSLVKEGVSFFCDNAYGTDTYGVRCYKDGHVTISADRPINRIVFELYGTYTGGLDAEVVVNASSWSYTLPSQARMTTISIYFGRSISYVSDTIMGTIDGPNVAKFGDTITIEATPNYGYHFVQWSDGVTDNPRAFKLTLDTIFTAEFAKNPYSISTTASSPEQGITQGDTIAMYLDSLEISATPNYGYHFVQWSDGIIENPRTILLTQDTTFIADFLKNPVVTYLYDETKGLVVGDSTLAHDTSGEITFEAIPNHGYEFVRWSDGVTENPRTIFLTKDTTFIAEFVQIFSGQCGDGLYWSYTDGTLEFSGSGNMHNYTENKQPWALFSFEISHIVYVSEMTSIGDYAFKNCTKIKQINVPNEVEYIGAHAYDSCIFVTSIYFGSQVSEIGDYAFKGCIRVNDITCMNTTTPVAYDNTLSSISQYAYLYVPAGSKRTYQLDPYWGRFDIKEIVTGDAMITEDKVTVEANEDNAIFTWPIDTAAATYSLQITQDNVVFCTLVFNANGQLIGIAFAPAKEGNSHAPAATTSIAGMSFTVTGLNGASKYAYRLAVSDEQNNELVAYRGEFATTGYNGEINEGGRPEAIENPSAQIDEYQKVLHNGQIFIRKGDKIYTLTGTEL